MFSKLQCFRIYELQCFYMIFSIYVSDVSGACLKRRFFVAKSFMIFESQASAEGPDPPPCQIGSRKCLKRRSLGGGFTYESEANFLGEDFGERFSPVDFLTGGATKSSIERSPV